MRKKNEQEQGEISSNTKFPRNPLVRIFAEILKRSRLRTVFTYEQMANALHVSVSYYKNLEVGIYPLSVSKALLLYQEVWRNPFAYNYDFGENYKANSNYTLDGTISLLGIIQIMESRIHLLLERKDEERHHSVHIPFVFPGDYNKALLYSIKNFYTEENNNKNARISFLFQPFLNQDIFFNTDNLLSQNYLTEDIVNHVENYLINFDGIGLLPSYSLNKIKGTFWKRIQSLPSYYLVSTLDYIQVSKKLGNVFDMKSFFSTNGRDITQVHLLVSGHFNTEVLWEWYNFVLNEHFTSFQILLAKNINIKEAKTAFITSQVTNRPRAEYAYKIYEEKVSIKKIFLSKEDEGAISSLGRLVFEEIFRAFRLSNDEINSRSHYVWLIRIKNIWTVFVANNFDLHKDFEEERNELPDFSFAYGKSLSLQEILENEYFLKRLFGITDLF